jgi:hypothetical protein
MSRHELKWRKQNGKLTVVGKESHAENHILTVSMLFLMRGNFVWFG